MDGAQATVNWGLVVAIIGVAGNAVFYYAVWKGRIDAQNQSMATALSNKAEKHEVVAVREKVESLERLVKALGDAVRADVEKSLARMESAFAEFRADFNREHRRRSDENLEHQYVGSELRERLAALETRVFGDVQKPPTPRRRAEDQGP